MYTTSDKMPPHSRVWVYQCDREFTSAEEKEISEKAKTFVETWTAHEKNLLASFEIRYHRFLILMIDEKQALASGCSIDKSVKLVQQLENDYNFSLMNRMLFAFKKKNTVEVVTKKDFEERYSQNIITENTTVFNNLVQTKAELDEKWEIRLGESWHKQMVA
jgi:hypothetical protein